MRIGTGERARPGARVKGEGDATSFQLCGGGHGLGVGGGRHGRGGGGVASPELGEGDLLVQDELVAVLDVIGVELFLRPLHLLGAGHLNEVLKEEKVKNL